MVPFEAVWSVIVLLGCGIGTWTANTLRAGSLCGGVAHERCGAHLPNWHGFECWSPGKLSLSLSRVPHVCPTLQPRRFRRCNLHVSRHAAA
jgi:hypothetical protein